MSVRDVASLPRDRPRTAAYDRHLTDELDCKEQGTTNTRDRAEHFAMMSQTELEAYRREHPDAAARADADRERVSALLVELLDYEGMDLDAVPETNRERVAELVRELVAEKCVDTDDVVWQVTGRGRALLAWRSETTG